MLALRFYCSSLIIAFAKFKRDSAPQICHLYHYIPWQTQSVGHHKSPPDNPFYASSLLQRPPTYKAVLQTWNVADVLQLFVNMGPPQRLSLRDLSKKTLGLIALLSVKRFSDLTLLDVRPQFCCVSRRKVILQPKFGAKQERQGHATPLITLLAVHNKALCPVSHIREYIDRTANIRQDSSFFCITVPPHLAASKNTLRTWMVQLLAEAGIEAPAGSTRAAAATIAHAARVPLPAILRCGDWSSAVNLYKHYTRQIPAEVITALLRQNSNPVQDAVMRLV